jgi:hypothetical protein
LLSTTTTTSTIIILMMTFVKRSYTPKYSYHMTSCRNENIVSCLFLCCVAVNGFNLTSNLFTAFCNQSAPRHDDLAIQYLVISGVDKMDRADTIWKSLGQVLPPGRLAVVSERVDGDFPYDFPLVEVMNLSKSLAPNLKYRHSQLKWLYSILNSSQFDPFDWLFLMDDDTFVIHSSLQQLLASYDSSDVLLLSKAGEPACHFVCGGAGMAFSKGLVHRLVTDPILSVALTHRFEQTVLHDKRPGTLFHSDVLLSRFLHDYNEALVSNSNRKSNAGAPGQINEQQQQQQQVIVARNEFKNFPPEVAMKWFRHTGKGPAGRQVVSFHRINDPDQYRALFRRYYASVSISAQAEERGGGGCKY